MALINEKDEKDEKDEKEEEDNNKTKAGGLTQKEKRNTGQAGFAVYLYYMKNAGFIKVFLFILSIIISTFGSMVTNYI